MRTCSLPSLPSVLLFGLISACGGTPTVNNAEQFSAAGSAPHVTGNVSNGGADQIGLGSGLASSTGGTAGEANTGGIGGSPGSTCGNGILDGSEGCDDANAKSGDGCDATCKVEIGYACNVVGQPCQSILFCGDSLAGPDESCDDGNQISGDGCSVTCQIESGFSCSGFGVVCTPTTTLPVCGNGTTEYGETCDDGNTLATDGCSAVCQKEPGFTCNGRVCTKDATCGNGVLNSGEQCDDGNLAPGDCCNGTCKLESNCRCTTPAAGSASTVQVCESTLVCGDGAVTGNEACDDGNKNPGDGCNADCSQVEAGYNCPPIGGACTKAEVLCPNGKIDPGEGCDDGNAASGDGCSTSCRLEAGYTCPVPGAKCQLKEYCGNGAVSYTMGESCDDGNTNDGDGCSLGCVIETGYTCDNSISPSVCAKEVCGNKRIAANESCDDANQVGGDGCSSSCQLEDGYTCPVVGNACRSICGDGLMRGTEQCDAGGDASKSVCCNSLCQIKAGYVWQESAGIASCKQTVCGDGIVEGTEQCDDTKPGATDYPFDGCYKCIKEPDCSLGSCKSACGDGQRFADEACDDGNTYNGDGCSSSCTVETGFTCNDSPASELATIKTLPVVVRDFVGLGRETNPSTSNANYHLDFNRHLGGGIFAMVKTTLGANGKPAWRWLPYATSAITSNTTSDRHAIPTPLSGCSCDEAAASWISSSETWTAGAEGAPNTFALMRPPCACTNGTACTCDNPGHLYKDGGVANSNRRNLSTPENLAQWYVTTPQVNLSALFMLDLTLDTATNSYSNLATSGATNFDPLGTGGFIAAGSETQSGCGAGWALNVSFTTETHFWFEYQGGEQFTFSGDDDMWVFVNKTLVVDLGGLHGKLGGSFVLDASNGTAVSLNNGQYYDGTNYANTKGNPVSLGLVKGSVYEVAMFQAERNQCGSNFGVTLKNFSRPRSNCSATCGDGIVASTEACDLGTANNNSAYGGCNSDCTLAPYCGDKKTNGPEQCDDGVNSTVYGSNASGCAPGCKIAPSCGDGKVDVAYGETCDNGATNSATAYGPGSCTNRCQTAPFCGNGSVDGSEACDDGQNNGTPTSKCDTSCSIKCGNGTLDPGEECDRGAAQNAGDYGGCKADCTLAPYCGDGIKQAVLGEACDDGLNDGSYGSCTAKCQLSAYCGDGHLDAAAGETCDNGSANQASAYGAEFCTTTCRRAPYCGDNSVDAAAGEVCDDGAKNSSTIAGACKLDCSGYNAPPSTCGNRVVDAGEDCDNGTANGTVGSACDGRCKFKCGNGIKDSGEQCDNGINDGSYGTCNHDCTLNAYCGDGIKNGPEQCDLGVGNSSSSVLYGKGLCTAACLLAPYCGDLRVNGDEQCDGQSNCDANCKLNVILL